MVRSDAQARDVVLSVELASLHLQKYDRLEALLAALQFGDGAAAALVTAESSGLGIDTPFAATLPESQSLIQWHVGDHGFAMHLPGDVPGRIAAALGGQRMQHGLCPEGVEAIEGWGVHEGGR